MKEASGETPVDAFDRKLESMRRSATESVDHEGTLDAAVYVHDTLEPRAQPQGPTKGSSIVLGQACQWIVRLELGGLDVRDG